MQTSKGIEYYTQCNKVEFFFGIHGGVWRISLTASGDIAVERHGYREESLLQSGEKFDELCRPVALSESDA